MPMYVSGAVSGDRRSGGFERAGAASANMHGRALGMQSLGNLKAKARPASGYENRFSRQHIGAKYVHAGALPLIPNGGSSHLLNFVNLFTSFRIGVKEGCRKQLR